MRLEDLGTHRLKRSGLHVIWLCLALTSRTSPTLVGPDLLLPCFNGRAQIIQLDTLWADQGGNDVAPSSGGRRIEPVAQPSIRLESMSLGRVRGDAPSLAICKGREAGVEILLGSSTCASNRILSVNCSSSPARVMGSDPRPPAHSRTSRTPGKAADT